MKGAIREISINGFKSIRELRDFELRDLNVIIGVNGSGKSNLVQVFQMLLKMEALTIFSTMALRSLRQYRWSLNSSPIVITDKDQISTVLN